MFEMEQVLPGRNPDDFDSDPIFAANDLKQAGDTAAALDILAQLIEADLRCLDAHAHLGNLHFQTSPDWAMNHYEVGFRIGELSLGADFDGVLAWDRIFPDDMMAVAAIDRLIHHAHVIELSGESYRKKTHTRRLQEATHKPRH